MGFLHQLHLLLWKNVTLKRRSPWVLAFEIFIPLVLFFILLGLRQKKPTISVKEAYYTAAPLTSAGILPVMQSLCPDGQRDELGFLQYSNSTVTQLLERLNEVAEKSNLFDPDQAGLEEELESLRRHLESLSSSEPNTMETHFSNRAAPGFTLDSTAKDKLALRRFLAQNLSLSNETAELLAGSEINLREVYRLFFGTSPVSAEGLHEPWDRFSTAEKLLHLEESLLGSWRTAEDGLVRQALRRPQKSPHKPALLHLLSHALGLASPTPDPSTTYSPPTFVKDMETILFTAAVLESLTCQPNQDELGRILLVPESRLPLLRAYQAAACNKSAGLREEYFGRLAAELKEQLDAHKIIRQYGIVLDAGSSHTAMFVYKWPADKENDTGIVSQHSACDVDGGGISSYVADPSAAGRSLTACLDQAQVDVPKERHAATPLYLGATAGMRLLNLTDPAASDRVLAAVSATMKQYPFDFRGARILSGEDEGVFGWVTANYLLENFIKYGWIGRWVRPKKKTLGAMDLGGASTQITFETPEVIESRPANEATLRLYGQTYKVYTHSFLCYGRDQILKRLLSKVLKAERYALQLSNPCWPVGYGKNFTVGSVYDSPCTEAEKPANYFPTAMAFSAFFYTVDFIRTQMKRRVAMPSDLEQAAHEICSATWSELLEKAPGLEKRLPDYCSATTFIFLILTRGYQFDNGTFPNIVFQRKAGDASIGWALGYMLNLTNMIPAEETGFWKGTAYGPWVGLVLLFVAIILATLAGIFCLLRSSKGRGAM